MSGPRLWVGRRARRSRALDGEGAGAAPCGTGRGLSRAREWRELRPVDRRALAFAGADRASRSACRSKAARRPRRSMTRPPPRSPTHLGRGRDVAVLCQGDPFFYGSFIYLFARLAARTRSRSCPACRRSPPVAAAARWPLAARNDVLAVIPAPLDDDAIARRLAAADAIAIIKLGRHFARVRDLLRAARPCSPHARYVERASLGERARAAARRRSRPRRFPISR